MPPLITSLQFRKRRIWNLIRDITFKLDCFCYKDRIINDMFRVLIMSKHKQRLKLEGQPRKKRCSASSPFLPSSQNPTQKNFLSTLPPKTIHTFLSRNIGNIIKTARCIKLSKVKKYIYIIFPIHYNNR